MKFVRFVFARKKHDNVVFFLNFRIVLLYEHETQVRQSQ